MKILSAGTTAKGRFAALTFLPSSRLVGTLALHRGIEDSRASWGYREKTWLNDLVRSRERKMPRKEGRVKTKRKVEARRTGNIAGERGNDN